MRHEFQVLKTRRRASVALIAVGAGLAGCGATGVAPAAGPGNPPAATATAGGGSSGPLTKTDHVAAYKYVCGLFTPQEAQTAMGDTQLGTSPAPFELSSNSGVLGVGDSAACMYMIPPSAELAQLSPGNPGVPAFIVSVDTKLSIVWGSVKAGKDKQAISGLGDEAYWQPGLDGGGVLLARKGATYVFISRMVQEGAPPDFKDREITLARSIVAKM